MSMTKKHLRGIVIEPIKNYFDKIPDNENVIKVNCAISNLNKNDGFMYYIPQEVIEEKNIVNCFQGMNRLDNYHMGHESNNLTEFVVKEKCDVLSYFSLLKKFNIEYTDYLKIDTEGHDCLIINNILDELKIHPNYILPRYIYFENNELTLLETRNNTIERLKQYGYIHIYTKDDNTFMYNCTTYYLHQLRLNNIILPIDSSLNNKSIHFFENVHSYLEYGQIDLFKNILKLNVVDNKNDSNTIWTTQDIDCYKKNLEEFNPDIIVNIVHGGGFIHSKLLLEQKLNIVVKSIQDYEYLINQKNKKFNTCLFIGKYKCKEKLFNDIFNYRQSQFDKFNNNFLLLNGFFKFNPEAIKNTYEEIKNLYNIDLFGYDSDKGWANIFGDENIITNKLSQYKFMLHLKGNGYLCNSVICGIMVGMPIIMSKDIYYKTLYHQFIPEELIILCDNNDIMNINKNELIPSLEYALNMSDDDYKELSYKLYLHGTFFRKYFNFELDHLNYFMNNFVKLDK